MTLLKFLQDSGILVIPLLASSVLALTVILERSFYWLIFWFRKDEAARRRILSGDTRLWRSKDRVAEILKEFMDHPGDPSIAKVEAERLIRDSRHLLKVLSWIASLSTSLGLLGTVVGVSFALKDLDDPNKLTPALAIALNTTILGLVIHLITYSCFNWFQSRSQALAVEMKELLTEAKRSLSRRSMVRRKVDSSNLRQPVTVDLN